MIEAQTCMLVREKAMRGLKMIIQAATGLPISYIHPDLFQ